jgi:hypothetical protein
MMDWRYNRKNRQWELTAGEWQAAVTRTDVGDTWHATIERIGADHEHLAGPDFIQPQEARSWCEREIARCQASEADT